jgi:tRNA threonylcarbamoyladenosine biosynthesis protein TsaB
MLAETPWARHAPPRVWLKLESARGFLVYILALDTSSEYCSAALWRDGVVDARDARAGQRHSAIALGMVDDLLAAHGLRSGNLHGIAYGQGPGSFTGLRIACGITQGLAFAHALPVVGIVTLLALAEAADAPRVVCCIDARMNEIYHAAYEKSAAGWITVHEPGLMPAAAAPPLPGKGWVGCGSGFGTYAPALVERYGEGLTRIEPQLYPHAREIVRLAVPLFEQGRTLRPEEAAPLYLRDKVALRTDERPR